MKQSSLGQNLWLSPVVSHSYYMLCIGSSISGDIRLSIIVDVREFTEKVASSSSGTSEIQQIDVGANVTSEYQVKKPIYDVMTKEKCTYNSQETIFSAKKHRIVVDFRTRKMCVCTYKLQLQRFDLPEYCILRGRMRTVGFSVYSVEIPRDEDSIETMHEYCEAELMNRGKQINHVRIKIHHTFLSV